MFLLILALLSVLQQTNPYQTTGKTKYNNNTSTLYSIICDDDTLKNIAEKLDRIERENENLRLKMDTMNMIMNHQFMELKATATTKDTTPTAKTETSKSNCGYSYDHLIDIRGNFNEDNECHTTVIDLPSNCAEALKESGRQSGIHKIRIPDSQLEPFYVYCMADPQQVDAAWTVIQRRMDGNINFYRKWNDYQHGFGNLETEFFIGLDKLHALTQFTLHELWIQMEDFEKTARSANYSSFAIGGENEAYALNILGAYSGDAGDSLTPHVGQKFTTKDVDNDEHDTLNCASEFTGGWWYAKCHESNLNGQYLSGAYPVEQFAKGIVWYKWHQHYYSLKYVHMAIRSVRSSKRLSEVLETVKF